MVQQLMKLERTRIAIMYQNDSYGRDGWYGIQKALSKENLNMVGDASYKRGERYQDHYQLQAKHLLKTNPEVIIIIATYEAAAGFIRDITALGYNQSFMVMSFAQASHVYQTLGSDVNYTVKNRLIFSMAMPSYHLNHHPFSIFD